MPRLVFLDARARGVHVSGFVNSDEGVMCKWFA